MRIAIVANDLGLGGAERQATLWARECAAMGHEVVVVVLGSLDRQYAVPDAIEVASLGKSHAADLPLVVRRLRAVTRDRDLAIAFQVYPALCCALARRGRAWLVVAGNDPRHLREMSRVPAPLFRWAFGRAALACAPTRGIVDCHERLGYRPRGRWLVVPNIVDREAFIEPTGDKQGILFLGRLAPEKNPQLAWTRPRRRARRSRSRARVPSSRPCGARCVTGATRLASTCAASSRVPGSSTRATECCS
jgi:glycosyltransferase involved in cell wall biosynthesis